MFLDSRDNALISEELPGDSNHDLTNVMTMEAVVHEMFDSLHFWLSPLNVRSLPGSLAISNHTDNTMSVARHMDRELNLLFASLTCAHTVVLRHTSGRTKSSPQTGSRLRCCPVMSPSLHPIRFTFRCPVRATSHSMRSVRR
jgi:hypothetical protein